MLLCYRSTHGLMIVIVSVCPAAIETCREATVVTATALHLMLVAVLSFAGADLSCCGQSAETAVPGEFNQDRATVGHSGWWCSEHGVFDGESALSRTSLVADFKAKAD